MPKLKTILTAAALFCTTLLANPAGAQEREWLLDAADEDAFLVFGVPETDDVGVSFWCKIGSGKVKVFFPEGSADLKPDSNSDFIIEIAGKPHTLKGTTTANAMSGATSIETELTLDDPIVSELVAADRFSARIGLHQSTYPLLDAGLENLVKLCRTK